VEVRFTKAARKHRVGRAAARHEMAHTTPTATLTTHGARAWLWSAPTTAAGSWR